MKPFRTFTTLNQTTSTGMFHSTSPEGDTLGLKSVFALDAHQNAHQVEANQRHIECALISFTSLRQCISYVLKGYTTAVCDKIAYVDMLPVLAIVLLFNCCA